MKRIFALLLSLAVLFSCLAVTAGAMFDPSTVYDVKAQSAYIVNTDTNIIVYEKDSEKQVSAGGLTKYMTIALVLTNYADQLDSTFTMPFAISDYVHNSDNADMRSGETFTYREAPMGGCAIDAFGVPLPESSLETCLASDSVLLGAVGGPKWDAQPSANRPERGLLKLRGAMGLYTNVRPARMFQDLAAACPLRPDIAARGIDLDGLRVGISGSVGQMFGALFGSEHLGTLLLTGGDTLLQCMNSVGARELEPVCELESGIVLARFTYQGRTRYVITKSGGFGQEDLLVELADRIAKH